MSIIETSKAIAILAKKGMTIELQETIMQLREEALELQTENYNLKTELAELKKKQELQETVTFKRKVYYKDGDEVPYCPYCYEKKQVLIHLIFKRKDMDGQVYHCQECRTGYVANGQEDFRYYYQNK